MAVTEVTRALGSWSLTLKDAPQSLLDLLQANLFGHVAIDTARDNPAILGDNLRAAARYVGPLRGVEFEKGTAQLSGCGMAFWLGDEDKKGDVFEVARQFPGVSFSSAITGLLPSNGAVTPGEIGGVPATYRGTHQWQSPREAIDYVCDLFDADWRVNGDATLDAGPTNILWPTTDNPTAAVIRRAVGTDMTLRALPGQAKLARDVEDFSTRVVTLAEGQGGSVRVGSANIAPELNTYLDMNGNPVKLTRMVSESNTSLTNANARAQLQLNRFTGTRDALTVTTKTHDLRGDVTAGDSIWMYDPDAGMVDINNEVVFRGERIFPVKLRVYELSWPVTQGMGVYFRTGLGVWIDLTDYVVWESGAASIKVGGYDRSLTNSSSEPVGSRVVADNSVPAAPTLTLPWLTSVYQSGSGFSRARILVDWQQPLNTDGTPIADGSNYDVQVKQTSGTAWTSQAVGFDQTEASIQELLPATSYDVRIRAVDTASPPNFGAWSTVQTVVTAGDTIAPATPAAPTVAGNPVAIQVKHNLGIAAGGSFNLDPDLHHLEVHISTTGAGFTPNVQPYPTGTQLGKMTATQGMMTASVAALATFSTDQTALLYVKVVAVDESGNRSAPSIAATATATLISDIYVSDLTATKITAGSFSAAYGITGLMISGNATAARWESGTRGSLQGGRTYRPSGTLALQLDALTGDLTTYQTNGSTKTFQVEASTGNVYLFKADGATPALSLTASTGALTMLGKLTVGDTLGSGDRIEATNTSGYPTLFFYDSTSGTNRAYINGIVAAGSRMALGLNSGADASGNQSTLILLPTAVQLQYNTFTGTPNLLRGGYLNLDGTGATLGHAPSGTATVYFQASGSSGGYIGMSGSGGNSVSLFNNGTAQIVTSNGNYLVCAPSGSQLVSNGTAKSFVINHPRDDPGNPQRWLVHACLEGPEAAVFHRGTAVIEDHLARVQLPSYFAAACRDGTATVHLTPELAVVDGRPSVASAAPTAVQDGGFSIICPAPDGTRVHWVVYATRADVPVLDVEPRRSDVAVHGDGPYRYLTPRPLRKAA